MIRGTTPEHIIKPPVAASLIKSVRFTYEQDGSTIVEKTEADCTRQNLTCPSGKFNAAT